MGPEYTFEPVGLEDNSPELQKAVSELIRITPRTDISDALPNRETFSVKTLRNMKIALNCALTQAVIDGHISFNPVTGVKLKNYKKPKMRVLTKEEQQSIESAVDASHDVSLQGVIIALYTGVRIGELLALRWKDVNLKSDPMEININSTLARQAAPDKNDANYEIIRQQKGRKTAITLGDPKTEQAERTLYLPKRAALAIRKLREWNAEMKKKCGKNFNKDGFVVFTLRGYPMEPRTYSDKLDAVVKAMGLEHVNFHALRHTYATRCVEEGMDIATLSANLGHAQMSTTLDMYVHSMDEKRRQSVGILDKDTDEKVHEAKETKEAKEAQDVKPSLREKLAEAKKKSVDEDSIPTGGNIIRFPGRAR